MPSDKISENNRIFLVKYFWRIVITSIIKFNFFRRNFSFHYFLTKNAKKKNHFHFSSSRFEFVVNVATQATQTAIVHSATTIKKGKVESFPFIAQEKFGNVWKSFMDESGKFPMLTL